MDHRVMAELKDRQQRQDMQLKLALAVLSGRCTALTPEEHAIFMLDIQTELEGHRLDDMRVIAEAIVFGRIKLIESKALLGF